jgi:glycosyltransferase involved in cell wall biosynthesis
VTAVIPARDEAGILPATLPSVLAQDYPGPFSVIVVDDASTDGTGQVAADLAEATPGSAPLHVLRGSGPPAGWAGKVAAMDSGVREMSVLEMSGREISARGNSARAGGPGDAGEFILFTDSDIAHPADSVRRLVQHAQDAELDLVSLMARLSTDSPAERMIVPAFVFSFFQLYPPAWVNKAGTRTAAAAGGCMLVRRSTLERVGGLAGIADARIDDVALGTLLKRGRRTCLARGDDGGAQSAAVPSAGRFVGHDRAQCLHPTALQPLAAARHDRRARGHVRGAADRGRRRVGDAVVGRGDSGLAGLGGAGRELCSGAAALQAALVARGAAAGGDGVYGAMTVDSARRHRQGRGGAWKGRVIESGE